MKIRSLKRKLLKEFLTAVERDDILLVSELIHSRYLDITGNNNQAVEYAAYHGKVEMLELLLDTGEIDPGYGNNRLMDLAYQNGYYEAIEVIKSRIIT